MIEPVLERMVRVRISEPATSRECNEVDSRNLQAEINDPWILLQHRLLHLLSLGLDPELSKDA